MLRTTKPVGIEHSVLLIEEKRYNLSIETAPCVSLLEFRDWSHDHKRLLPQNWDEKKHGI